jgi:hydroxymethylpyrimidine pyrophosphatase-like HAD family hydrolase
MKPLILIDLDETLVDCQYQLTADASLLHQSIRDAQRLGYKVGINSDSSLATLQHRAREFAMQGPLVAERGGTIATDADANPIYTVSQNINFQNLRDAFIARMTSCEQAQDWLVLCGNVNAFANRLPDIPEAETSARFAVLINTLRKASFSCFARERDGNSWALGKQSLSAAYSELKHVAARFPELWESRDLEINERSGILIFHHTETRKLKCVGYLCENTGYNKIYMIGDSMGDFMDDERVIHCAVGNASAEYRSHCSMVAQAAHTAGVTELITGIIK